MKKYYLCNVIQKMAIMIPKKLKKFLIENGCYLKYIWNLFKHCKKCSDGFDHIPMLFARVKDDWIIMAFPWKPVGYWVEINSKWNEYLASIKE